MKNDTPLAEARRRWDELFTKLTNDREWCKTQRFFHENLFDVYDMIVESREFRLMEKKVGRTARCSFPTIASGVELNNMYCKGDINA